jgi:LysM repeat protein
MKPTIVLMLLAGLSIAACAQPVAPPHQSNTITPIRDSSEMTFKQMAAADTVETFLVNGWKTDLSDQGLSGVALLHKGPLLSAAQKTQLKEILLKGNFLQETQLKKCEFAPEIALRFKHKNKVRTVLIATSCDMWAFSMRNNGKEMRDGDKAHDATMQLFTQVFGQRLFDHFEQIKGGKGVLQNPLEEVNAVPPTANNPAPPAVPRNNEVVIVTYKVLKNDNLRQIAQKYNVSTKDLMAWNSLKSDKIKENQVLKVHTLQ